MAHPKSFIKERGLLFLLPLLLVFLTTEANPAPLPTIYKVLTVTKSGYGGGTVTSSNVSGISCGSDCSQSYSSTLDVTLTAEANAGCSFLGWYVRRSDGVSGGEYTGPGTCTAYSGGSTPRCIEATYTVDMVSAKTVTAYFYIPPVVTFNTFIAGTIKPALGGAVIRTTENYAISLPAGNFLMVHDPGTFTVNVTADGCDPYTVTSVAVAEGLTTTVPEVTLNCSWAATLLSSTGQAFESGSGTGNVTVTIPSSLYWTAASNASWITITAPTGTANGNGTVSYSVAANGKTSPRTGTLTIAGQTFTVTQENPDTTAPKVTRVTATSPTSSLTIPVTITATDDRDGTINYLVTASSKPPLAGAAGWAISNLFPYTVAAAGTYSLYGWAKDAAGNVSSAATPVRVTVDQKAPATTANPTTGTYGPGLTVTLTADETATIYYTTNGSTPTTSSSVYSAGAPIAIPSTATLQYFARDPAGNVEGVKSQTYTIDTAGPSGSIAVAGGITHTNSSTVSLVLSASDEIQMQFSNDGTTWTSPETFATIKIWTLTAGDGMKTIYAKFKDSVGNWSNAFTAPVTLDTIAPVTTASPAGGYYDSVQYVILSANEESTIYYTTNGVTPSESSIVYANAPIPISTTTKLKFFAKDPAGNSETVKTQVYIQSISMGDVNTDTLVDLTDAVLALQVLSGIAPAQPASDRGAVTLDGKVGLAEAIFILQKVAGLR